MSDQTTEMLLRLYRLQREFADYHPGAPSPYAESIDREIAEGMSCCGQYMTYQPYTRNGSYVALAICSQCGESRAF